VKCACSEVKVTVIDIEEYRAATKTGTEAASVQFSSVLFSSVPNTGTRNVEQVSLSSRTSVTIGPASNPQFPFVRSFCRWSSCFGSDTSLAPTHPIH